MCGIVGFYSTQRSVDRDKLFAAMQILSHRGPDGQDYWVSQHNDVALAHTRLSVVGINNGAQPLKSADNNLIAVVNGEFYDYQVIKQKLSKLGHKFYTDTDSELIIPLYLEYGLNFIEHLNGEFAFIIFDKIKNKIIAGRDRFGVKPLYFSWDNSNLYISSEVKALFKMGIAPELNAICIANYCYGLPKQEVSSFKNIKPVLPGHFIIVTGNNIKQEKYWDLKFSPDKTISLNDAVVETTHLLKQAVNRRLLADRPVGCYLSGGIDSSSILAMAVKDNPSIKALTICFTDNPSYNESDYAVVVADHLNVELLTLNVNQDDLATHFEDAIYYQESPVYQTSGIAKMLLSRFAKSAGIDAVITGEGADEMLVGYPSFIQDYIDMSHERNQSTLLLNKLIERSKETESAYVSLSSYDKELITYKNKLGYIPSFLKLSYEIAEFSKSILNQEFISAPIIKNFHYDNLLNCIDKSFYNIVEPVSKSVYFWSKTYFPEMILSYLGDRMEMANGVEARLPFLDVDLVSFLTKIPASLKIGPNLEEKFILRNAARNILPSSIYNRKKHIFASPPITNRIKGVGMFSLMQNVFSSDSFRQNPFYSQEKVLSLLKMLPNLDKRSVMIAEFSLNVALSTHFLYKRWGAV